MIRNENKTNTSVNVYQLVPYSIFFISQMPIQKNWVGGKKIGSVGLQETNLFFRPHRYFVATVYLHLAWRMVLCLDNGKEQCPDVRTWVSPTP